MCIVPLRRLLKQGERLRKAYQKAQEKKGRTSRAGE